MRNLKGPNSYRIEGERAFIALTQGKEAIIDVADLETVLQYRWCAHMIRGTFYASSRPPALDLKYITMHRHLLGFPDSDVDHIDGDGLNNTRGNLRACSRRQNTYNSKKRATNRSGFKGVCFDKARSRWMVQIKDKEGRNLNLGRFETAVEAAHFYDSAAKQYYGEFARLNFPEERSLAA